MKRGSWFADVVWLIVAIIMAVLILFPIVWMVLCSMKENVEIFSFPPSFFPRRLDVRAYESIFSDEYFVRAFLNSLIVCLGATLISLLISVLAAYGFTRYDFFGKKLLQQYILTTQMMPIILLALPYFVIWIKIGLHDTLLGLMISYISFTLPFCSLVMINFLGKIPKEIDEAALIDGCSPFGAFFRTILPLCGAGIVATGLFAFMYAWNEYLMAVVLTASPESRVLTIFLGRKRGEYTTLWNELMATSTMASLPIVFVYAFLQRFFVRGITAGALKA